MSLPVVQLETIQTANAQFDRDGATFKYVARIGRELEESQPHMKQALVASVRDIMGDLVNAGVEEETSMKAGAAILTLCYMVIHSIEAQVEIEELEG